MHLPKSVAEADEVGACFVEEAEIVHFQAEVTVFEQREYFEMF